MVLLKVSETPENIEMLNRRYGNVEISTNFETIWKINNYHEVIPLFATIQIDSLPIDDQNFWKIPDKERKECEKTLEHAAAIMALCNGVKQQLFSVFGAAIFFSPDTPDEKNLLASCKGYNDKGMIMHMVSGPPTSTFDWDVIFSDRKSGILLINEALSHTTSSGKFRDYIRLFENAFGLSTKELPKKLTQFLHPKFGYSRDEIRQWTNIRDPLSHADNKENSAIYYESDITPYIDRVEQAAYDVLFNKLKWGNKSSERKDVWLPGTYTTSPHNEGVATPGSRFKIHLRDRFDVYPIYVTTNFVPFNNNWVTDIPIATEYLPFKLTIGNTPVPIVNS
jgi:hypothetical protein